MNTEKFYLYAGRSDHPHGLWKFIPDNPQSRQEALDQGYTAFSTMAFAYEPEKGKAEPLRTGSLFLDFDSKKDPYEAITHAKIFVNILENQYGVDRSMLRYWISGGKGAHLEIPAIVFGGEGGDPYLPFLHREIIRWIVSDVPILKPYVDFQLYCMGKGKLLRAPNIKRANGRYKVPVTAEEFQNMSPASLYELTANPRTDLYIAPCELVPSPALTDVYELVLALLRRNVNPRNSNPLLEDLFRCDFLRHAFENRKTLSEPEWWAMISVLRTFGNSGRELIHIFSRRYPGYSQEETNRKIGQANDKDSLTCNYIKTLHDCGKSCGVRSPADIWRHARSTDALASADFTLKEDGLYYTGPSEPNHLFLCTPFKILGRTCQSNKQGWGRLVSLTSPDGTVQKVQLNMRDLSGKWDSIRSTLLDYGLEIPEGPKINRYLMEYIRTGAVSEEIFLTFSQIGWIDDGIYLLPNTYYGEEFNRVFCFQGSPEHFHKSKHTVKDWQDHVGRYCQGNTLLTLVTAYAFTGPLLRICGAEGGGMHIYGSSSSGKTTCAYVAGSVCGGGGRRGYIFQWRTTSNALEGTAALHNDNLLVLDEIGQANSDDVANVAYMLANGQSKLRMNRDGSAATTKSWLLNFLSTGELTINDKIREGRTMPMAGQSVRVIDLPIDAGCGANLFQNLHGCKDGAELSEILVRKSKEFYGSPLRDFLKQLCGSDNTEFEKHVRQLKEDLNIFKERLIPPQASGQVVRVAAKFALIAEAGELAVRFGILSLSEGDVREAVQQWFAIWLEQRQGVGDQEIAQALKKVRDHFAQHETNRYASVDGNYEYAPSHLAGYRWQHGNTRYCLMLSPIFEELVGMGIRRRLIEEMNRLGWLAHTSTGKLMETKSVHGVSKRGVVFTPAVWEGKPDEPTTPSKPIEEKPEDLDDVF